MVGLSIVLEAAGGQKGTSTSVVSQKNPQLIINKLTMMKPSSSPPSYKNWKSSSSSSSTTSNSITYYTTFPSSNNFLEYCFLCKQKLLAGNDIYMYKGDKAFCSEECRYKQIFMDEEEIVKSDNCLSSAMKPQSTVSSSSSSSRTNRKGTKNRPNGFFAY